MTEALQRTEYYYSSSNALQNVAVWQFPPDQIQDPLPGTKKYWLIFIHGGAWRDPRATFNEAEPTLTALLSPSSPPSHHLAHAPARIAGIASLNYRLSPHPSFAQAPDHTPAFAARAARHPDHLVDVRAGLRFLQAQFGFGSDYVLFGHSAGGMLAFQTLLGDACFGGRGEEGVGVELPVAVVGFEGIYDLNGLNGRMGGSYAGFLEAAFGRDEELEGGSSWDAASPATTKGASFKDWSKGVGKIAVLAHSPDDELVDMAECDTMEARLRRDDVGNVRVYRDLQGGHFEVLNDGSFARVLRDVWDELDQV